MLPIPATIDYLRRAIGREVVSSVMFDMDWLTTLLWRLGIVAPPQMIIDRLYLTEQIVRQVEQVKKSTDAIRMWFESTCVETNNKFISPADAIRKGHFDAARDAANQLTKGVAHG